MTPRRGEISNEEPAELKRLSPEQQAQWRTYYYGNAGFEERARAEVAKVVGVALGDSWFDYLPARLFATGDIIDRLNVESSPYNVLRTAVAGDTIENMIWGTGYWSDRWTPQDTRQLPGALKLIRQHNAAFFLCSGGGNDTAGTPFANYLNHASSRLPPLRQQQLDWLINDYIGASYDEMIRAVRVEKPGLPIILHGYDYPVADGRGVVNFPLGYHFIGPWLRPAFAMKRIDTQGMINVLAHLIDTFNEMLKKFHNPSQGIYHLDLRNTLAKIKPGDYKAGWVNELHPTDKGFEKIAQAFADQIAKALHPAAAGPMLAEQPPPIPETALSPPSRRGRAPRRAK